MQNAVDEKKGLFTGLLSSRTSGREGRSPRRVTIQLPLPESEVRCNTRGPLSVSRLVRLPQPHSSPSGAAALDPLYY